MTQRITRLATDQKIPGSNPGKLVDFFLYSLEISFSVVVFFGFFVGVSISLFAFPMYFFHFLI